MLLTRWRKTNHSVAPDSEWQKSNGYRRCLCQGQGPEAGSGEGSGCDSLRGPLHPQRCRCTCPKALFLCMSHEQQWGTRTACLWASKGQSGFMELLVETFRASSMGLDETKMKCTWGNFFLKESTSCVDKWGKPKLFVHIKVMLAKQLWFKRF